MLTCTKLWINTQYIIHLCAYTYIRAYMYAFISKVLNRGILLRYKFCSQRLLNKHPSARNGMLLYELLAKDILEALKTINCHFSWFSTRTTWQVSIVEGKTLWMQDEKSSWFELEAFSLLAIIHKACMLHKLLLVK